MSDYDRFCEHGTYLGRNCEHCKRLVERLREVQGNVTKSYRNPEGPEAADEIERLLKQNERLRLLQEDIALRCLHQEDENKRLRDLTENDGKEIGSYREGTGLRGENQRLRAALERIVNEPWNAGKGGWAQKIAREALNKGEDK